MRRLELVHFQITKNCNLRCWFCGQWGKKGFFADDKGVLVSLDGWKKVIKSLKEYGAAVGRLPDVILWGGEPLVSPIFDELAAYLKENGFKVGMVTNGVLIDKHYAVINEAVSSVYVSIDGYKSVHDSIRGEGVYDKVLSNLRLIDTNKVKLYVMSVTSADTLKYLTEFSNDLASARVNKLILQDRITLKKTEAEKYKEWLKTDFGLDAISVDGYVDEDYIAPNFNNLDLSKYKISISHNAQGVVKDRCCLSPERHAHIAWNGNVLFCTDFFDFCCGNINDGDIIDIFNGEEAAKYRSGVKNGKNPLCEKCSWKNSESFYL